MSENIAVVAPMPSASETTATAAKPGLRLAYGFKGERVPGKVITIIGNDSDNGLRIAERAFWISSGVLELALSFIQLHGRYKIV